MSIPPATLTPAARERIEDLDRDLSELRQDYEAAKAQRLNNGRARDALDGILDLLDTFTANDHGEKAVYLIGVLQGMLNGERRQRALIAKVEMLRERRRKLEKP